MWLSEFWVPSRLAAVIETVRLSAAGFVACVTAKLLLAAALTGTCVAQEHGETLRAIVGFEQAGASSASSVQRFFGDVFVSIPFPWNGGAGTPTQCKFDFGPRVRMFGDVRITTVPQQIRSGIGEFVSSFPQQIAAVKVNEIAQATEFLAGTEVFLIGTERARRGFAGATFNRFTLDLLVQAGATTPLTPRQSQEVFDIGPGTLNDTERARLEAAYPQTKGMQYAAFSTKDRDRFFRQYYGGFRFKTYYFEKQDSTVPLARYPSSLDVTMGVNEAVTGGRLRGTVLRIDFFQSVPVGGWPGSIFCYATFLLKPVRASINDPLLLRPASDVVVPASNVAMLFNPQINRDYYRIGVGVELLSLIKQLAHKDLRIN